MTEIISKPVIVLLPVMDMLYPGTNRLSADIRIMLQQKGFKALEKADDAGFQKMELPKGWKTVGDIHSSEWRIIDEHCLTRLNVRGSRTIVHALL
ncbi:hypothetical protein KW783_00705 [Candidatus Parcubacteria bacterium]|nr:hypothetical protein [Candidatus Parcubacteria bacterium]